MSGEETGDKELDALLAELGAHAEKEEHEELAVPGPFVYESPQHSYLSIFMSYIHEGRQIGTIAHQGDLTNQEALGAITNCSDLTSLLRNGTEPLQLTPVVEGSPEAHHGLYVGSINTAYEFNWNEKLKKKDAGTRISEAILASGEFAKQTIEKDIRFYGQTTGFDFAVYKVINFSIAKPKWTHKTPWGGNTTSSNVIQAAYHVRYYCLPDVEPTPAP